MSLKLRQFQFYTYHEVLDRSTRSSFSLLKNINISCITAGKEYIIIGDTTGTIYVLNKLLSCFSLRFGAYSLCIVYMYMSAKIPFLFCIGNDIGESRPIVKIFDLKTTNNLGVPFCSTHFKLFSSDENAIVSAVAIFDNLAHVAVGFSSGTIILLKRDIIGKKGLKEKELRNFNIPITGLEFIKEEDNIFLFITTQESVDYIDIQKKSNVFNLDTSGCNPNCHAVLNTEGIQEFYIANESSINCYTSSGRTKCIPVSGIKGTLRSFKNNLILTLKNHRISKIIKDSAHKQDTLQIITIEDKLKYTSFIREVPDVADIVFIWGSLYVFLSNGQLFELIEMDLENKIKILFGKNLFDLAINLARKYSDAVVLNQIICKFGDFLYSKGDTEQAMTQYIQTIGTIEPSYIIKKYLDAQNIHCITTYLESLHKTLRANSDHTTLLLNCYIRLKDTKKLDEFLREDNEWKFDVETALRVCHQAGFIEQALYLARKSNHHSWYLKIQLEDVKDYGSALEYLKNLKIIEAESVLKNYGRRLLKDTPQELVEFLKYMCTFSETNTTPCLPEKFIHIFIQQRNYLRIFLEYIIGLHTPCSSQIYNTLIEIYVYEIANCNNQAEKDILETKCLNILNLNENKYDLDHALMLCQLNNFIKGLVALYEKMQKFSMILQYHMEVCDYQSIINDCIKYGQHEPYLWIKALEFFTKNSEECEKYLKEIISYVNLNNLITPLDLIETLSKSEKTEVRLIKDYINEHFKNANSIIQKVIIIFMIQNNEEIVKRKHELSRIQQEIASIESGNKVFQNSKCSMCQNTLELPVVHYLCGHSYHQYCAESLEQDNECPICNEKAEMIKQKFDITYTEKELSERFEKEISISSDPFQTAFKYFKYDIFNNELKDGFHASTIEK